MSFYDNKHLARHIRQIVTGIMTVAIGASAMQINMAAADALPNPGWGTVLAVQPDTGSLITSLGEHIASIVEARPETLKTMYVDATAYTSSPEETDADPFVTADGSDVRDGIIATNVLPFGTKVRIPTVYGDRIFEVHDRMNARYSYRIDVWMADKQDMRQFGLKRNIPIEVVEWGDNTTQWTARAEKLKQERLAKQREKEVALQK